MKRICAVLSMPFFYFFSYAQVGINTTSPNAQLDIRSSNQSAPEYTDGVLIPKIDAFPLSNPTVSQQGMLVYLNTVQGDNLPGFYWWDNTVTAWIPLAGGTLDNAYDHGGPGVGRLIDATDGAVHIAGEDGLYVTGSLNNGDDLTLTGEGAKMFFYPKKAAFRAGYTFDNQWNNDNIGAHSTALGYNPIASGIYSIALGFESISAAPFSITIGNNSSANEINSVAIGSDVIANAPGSFALGVDNISIGGDSFSIGSQNTCLGTQAFAIGTGNFVDGLGSLGMGYGTQCIGHFSTALGYQTEAHGQYSTTQGYLNKAEGYYSSVWGYKNTAQSAHEVVFGRFARIGSGDAVVWVPEDRLFVIGNGESDFNRSNALTILKNGRMGLQFVTNPTYALHLTNDSDPGIGSVAAYTYYYVSDQRVKSNIAPLTYGLEEILQLKPFEYIHHSSNFSENGNLEIKKGTHAIGFLAQDLYTVIPEIVHKPKDDATELWTVDYGHLTTVLVKAIQEQQKIIESQKKEIELLKNLDSEVNILKAQQAELRFLIENRGVDFHPLAKN